jgi:hypothetical protein
MCLYDVQAAGNRACEDDQRYRRGTWDIRRGELWIFPAEASLIRLRPNERR